MTATAPAVSVVIANYNYAAFVGEAIESALHQSHAPVEVIVVDDGSTDNSRDVIARYPVRLLCQSNQGVSAARNFGAVHTRGNFLMFLDADDVLRPEYVARCLAALNAAPARVAYAYTAMELMGADTGIFASMPFDQEVLLHGNFINASALLRRDVFLRSGGFNVHWRLGYEDYELWIRLLWMGYVGVHLPEPLLRYRRHTSSRNTLSREQRSLLRGKLCGAYPLLYLRSWWWRPHKALRCLYWMTRERLHGALDARRPPLVLATGAAKSADTVR